MTVDKCGFVFVGTPHYGSEEAQVGIWKLALATKLGLNEGRIQEFDPYHSNTPAVEEIWEQFDKKKKIPVVCFCEQRKTPIPPKILKREAWVTDLRIVLVGNDTYFFLRS